MEPSRDIDDIIRCVATRTWAIFAEDPVLYVLAAAAVIVVGAASLGVLAGPMAIGFVEIVRRRIRGEDASLPDLFGGMGHWVSAIFATVLIAVATAVGLALLVLPGLAVLLFSLFCFPCMVYLNLRAGGALRASFSLVRSNFAPSLALGLAVVVLNLVGASMVFGQLLTLPLTFIALTVGFEELTGAADLIPAIDDDAAASPA